MDPKFVRQYIQFEKTTNQWIDRINAKPSYPWLTTAIGAFMAIPGLRGFWPTGSFNAVNGIMDLSGQVRTLTNTGTAQMLHTTWGAPYAVFDGTNDYFTRADEAGLDITGTETYVFSTHRGITLGGWFWFDALAPANSKGVISKWFTTGNQRAYEIIIPAAASTVSFRISVDGTAVNTVASTTTLSTDTWYFIAARFEPSAEINITINGTQNEDVNAIGTASIFNSSANFNIMADNNGLNTSRNDGRASFCFLSCMNISDDIINTLFETSRGIYGV